MKEVKVHSLFTEFDIELFKRGHHYRLYEKLGSHLIEVDGEKGTYFAVWAPSARSVSVIGDFNYWVEGDHQLNVRWDESGIWEGFIPGVEQGAVYKYKIHSHHNDVKTEKADPYAKRCEHPPKTASVVWDLKKDWKDGQWMKKRKSKNALDAPFSVYEVHLGSWKKQVEENRFLSYTELADELVTYVKEMNFTHVEFMPIMEFPYDPSWGYQITGYYAPSSRFGYPEEFMTLIETFHKNDIGVILDWVPSHFPEDAHGLGMFDGTALYEHPDRKKGYHPDWKSLIFNYERPQVKAFLISNALFWLDKYHIDGLRVDAVASMLFLDYSREEGEWDPNIYGGNEYLGAIDFLKTFNEEVYKNYPDVQTIAEESTSFPMVSKPTFIGGLGFGMKWMMGWMHDTLEYFAKEPVYRKHHQNEITFSLNYAFTENFMLPLSHDEVVYGKQSLINKMPGDQWQKFANLRLLFGFMYLHPGTKLIFQGGEFGQYDEWNFEKSLDWHLLDHDFNKGINTFVKDLNLLYKNQKPLFEKQFSHEGFEWIDYGDAENSVLCFIRKGKSEKKKILAVFNFTPVPRHNYRIGLPELKSIEEIFSSDAKIYHGSGDFQNRSITIENIEQHSRAHSAEIQLPPLGMSIFEVKS
ncbi:1,4-alpha-glucan branching protein GlgB [Psychroflexus montanilacus]|uniref:1,4-alpha-glucan branching protein GlgB n=1 Tax=Psychroflexus montanilacus TaxID=2873598 RepID=UPI001CCE5E46|nr:1,4-alpha-glucan branching protein GlgB [Psychroflexus montanilacus]MBZ9651153.1 1,4-alpha-glucan branching protein GlgB [Psychroflexus montanilacus]